jgi:DNA repair exonuclease SbcCD nuclease subunit
VIVIIKIIHISDTHLGKRPKRTRPSIINQEIKPIEDDFYNVWKRFVDEVINNNDLKPDIILHSGDFFDSPSGTDPNPPPELARKVVAETFKKLHYNKIPVVIIDGNHGRYTQYRISTLSEYPILFDNVYLFTYFELRDSIRNKKPLFKDFPELKLRVHAHPSIESIDVPQLFSKYKEWILIQNNNINPEMINIGLAHGMIENETLHSDFLMGDYDYVALGDNHKMQQVTDRAWYAGSTELWSFGEQNYNKGYLIIDIDSNDSKIKLSQKFFSNPRKIVSEDVSISDEDTNIQIIERIKNIFNKNNLNKEYDYSTAARVKISLIGNKNYGSFFHLNEITSYLNKITLDSNEYNIVEFILDTPHYSEFDEYKDKIELEDPFIEYLIEDPEQEFKEYINSTRKEDLKKNNLDSDLLAKFFFEALKG